MSKLNLVKAYLKKPKRVKGFILGYGRKILLQTGVYKLLPMSYYPKTLFINLTNTCNAHCKMCQYESSGRLNTNVEQLSLDDIKKLVDEVAPYSPNISFVGGGEPLTHKNIVEIVRYIHSKGLFVGLTTNGILLKDYAKDLALAGLDYVTISLDGPAEVHNKIRGVNNCYQKAIEGIKEIKKYGNVIVQTSTTVFDMNYDKIPALLKELSELPIDAKFGALMMNFTNSEQVRKHNMSCGKFFTAETINYNALDLGSIGADVFLKMMQTAEKEYGMIWMYSPKSKNELTEYFANADTLIHKERVRCPWLYSTITNTGNVVFCIDMVANDGMILGNFKKQSFKDIWNGNRAKEFRKFLEKNERFHVCSRCCAYINPWNGL